MEDVHPSPDCLAPSIAENQAIPRRSTRRKKEKKSARVTLCLLCKNVGHNRRNCDQNLQPEAGQAAMMMNSQSAASMMMIQRAPVKLVLWLAFLIAFLNFDVDVEPYDKGGRYGNRVFGVFSCGCGAFW